MPTASADSTFSVTGVNTPECIQQQAAVAAGGQHSCSRCPMVDAETEFDVLLVAEASGAASSPQHITVSWPGMLSVQSTRCQHRNRIGCLILPCYRLTSMHHVAYTWCVSIAGRDAAWLRQQGTHAQGRCSRQGHQQRDIRGHL